MAMKGIIFALLTALSLNLTAQTTLSRPGAIERFAWVGGNKEGTVVAFVLSHFGPASGAPFATLVVKKADEVMPVFTENASMMRGGERELAQLAAYLIDKNADYLKTLNIEISNTFISEAHAAIPRNDDPALISGWLDIENRGLKSFIVASEKTDVCPDDINRNIFGLTIRLDRKQLNVPANSNLCTSEHFMIRNVYRAQKTIWFVVYQHTYGLGLVDTWWVDIEGITV
jgi:hypothetical protein